MPIVKLSSNFVSKAVCPEGKKKINYYHKDIRGFLLEVRSSGGKTYALRYRDEHNRQCQYKIGDSKDISFEKARRAAEKARGKVVLGQDPSEDKRTKRKVPTLSYFVQFQFLTETLTLTAAGGLLGFLITMGIIAVFPASLDEYVGTPQASPLVIGTTTLLLGLIGLVAGYFPARRASLLDPVVALKLS